MGVKRNRRAFLRIALPGRSFPLLVSNSSGRKSHRHHFEVIPHHFHTVAGRIKAIGGHFYPTVDHLNPIAGGFYPIPDPLKVIGAGKKPIAVELK
jgi:hypothetical protein